MLRGGEIESMSWEDIDFDAAIWTIPSELSKNGLAHRVPLNSQACKILKSLFLSKANSKWVFPSPLGPHRHIENIQKAIQRIRAQEECGIDFVGHDLRRTAATHMASMGIPRLVIAKILNHVEQGVTAVYDRHAYDKEKQEALQLWGNRVDKLVFEKKS